MTERNAVKPKHVSRRLALETFGALGAALAFVGCGSDSAAGGVDGSAGDAAGSADASLGSDGASGADAAAAADASTADASTTCATTPEETAGPYPDKTNMIGDTTYFRQDITEGKTGLALSVTFLIVNVSGGCAPVADATVEVWHCDAAGVYSEYAGQPGATDQTGTTYLRGLQKTDANGQARFTTIYPGWYMGRATHIHVEVYVGGVLKKTTQMAFPETTTAAVYRSGVYASHGQNTTTNETDMVFSDGDTLEMASLTGDTTNGYAASLTIGI